MIGINETVPNVIYILTFIIFGPIVIAPILVLLYIDYKILVLAVTVISVYATFISVFDNVILQIGYRRCEIHGLLVRWNLYGTNIWT